MVDEKISMETAFPTASDTPVEKSIVATHREVDALIEKARNTVIFAEKAQRGLDLLKEIAKFIKEIL